MPDPIKRVEIGDAVLPGLYLVVQPSGAISWAVRTRIDGQPAKITIGPYPAHGLAEARAKAAELLRAVAESRDPRREQVEAREKAKRERAETLRTAIALYLADRGAELRPRSLDEVKRHLLKHWAPLHERPLRAITRAEIADRLLAIKATSGPVARNRARSALSALYGWCEAEEKIEASPVRGTRKVDEKPRDRVLSLDELRAIWQVSGDSGSDHDAIVRLLILTGQRREEIGALRWSEIVDLDGAEPAIGLPPIRTKNGEPHRVPLSPPAVALLRARPRRPGSDTVFGARAGRPFAGWSRVKARLDARLAGLAPWVLHDLRRSVATHLNEHGLAAPHVVEALLNHVSGHRAGVAGVYNRAIYAAELRRAVAVWATLLLDRAAPGLVPLKMA